jgi:hypothetical protein
MKIFEVIEQDQEPVELSTTVEPQPEQPQQPIPQPVEQQPQYAPKAELVQLAASLKTAIPDGRFEPTGKTRGKPVEHIRVFSVSRLALVNALVSMGYAQADLRPEQTYLSTKYAANIFSFIKDNQIYSFVISSKGSTEEHVGVGIKEYSPTNLGLAGQVFTREKLVDTVKTALAAKATDENLKSALLGLVDIAVNRGNGQLPPELNQAISQDRNQLSVDFGEVLAPIAIMDDEDEAEFPVGNMPLIDVRVGNQNISVKSLSGSGTSFRSIAKLMDKYEEAMTDDHPQKSRFDILKKFHPSAGGNNKDKIVSATAQANIPEYVKLLEILDVEKLTSFNNITVALKVLNITDYATFLNTFYPAMTAGDWGKPVGLPADGAYYMGTKAEAPKTVKQAGKRSFDADPVEAGADILTYVLGVGLLNYITRGADASEYSNVMTDIVNKADAVLGKIDITVAGGLSITTKPFSTLKFAFQYHAPSHIPGNNLPGFMAIID